MEANWTDPILFFIYSVAKPLASALILVVMLDVISGGAKPEYRAFVVVGSALWSFVLSGIAGLAWMVLDDRERYRMLKYVYVSPSDFLVVLLGRGVARIARRGDGRADHAGGRRRRCSACRSTRRRSTGRCSSSSWRSASASILAIGVLLAAICIQTRQESWSYPEAAAGALFLISRRGVPARRPAGAAPGDRPADAADVVDRGRPAGALPGRR